MKVLSLHQPWASLVACGYKRIETRSWSTRHRGPLAIHATRQPPREGVVPGEIRWSDVAQRIDGSGWLYAFPEPWTEEAQAEAGAYDCAGDLCEMPLPLGAVVAVCQLADVAPVDTEVGWWSRAVIERRCVGDDDPCETLMLPRDQRAVGDFSPGRFAWHLDQIVPLWPAVPARGRQGLWDWEAP